MFDIPKKMMKSILVVLLMTITAALVANSDWKSFSKDKSIELKVDSVMKLMTLEEKIGQMTQVSCNWDITGPVMNEDYKVYLKKGLVGSVLNAFSVDGIRKLQDMALKESRLKIPLLFGYDVIHGYRTIFPIPLAESCSWNPELMKRTAAIAAIEASAEGINWTFAPMVDISRDPRWGRVMEGAGEDPYLGSLIAKARIEGFQGGKDWKSLKEVNTVLACCKHFAGYGAAEGGRDYNVAELSLHTLLNDYMLPYEAANEAGVATYMAAFNEIAGVPCTSNKWLMTDLLRNQWDFNGFIVSDYTGINELMAHGVAENKKAAGELAVNAGIDMDMAGVVYANNLAISIKEGKVSLEAVENAVRRILEMKFLLGLFDDPYHYLDNKREKQQMMKPEFLKTSQDMAAQSIVLLKNDKLLFPISKEKSITIALIGPMVKDRKNQIGLWQGKGNPDHCVTLFEGLQEKYKDTNVKFIYAEGCDLTSQDRTKFAEAEEVAKQADIIMAAMGEPANYSGEANCRTNIQLPGIQKELLAALKKLNKPIGLIVMNGRPLDLSWENANVDAIFEAWFLGIRSGYALADVISGDYNPSGRLTMTFPRNIGQIPVYYNHKNTGRPLATGAANGRFTSSYMDIPNSPLFPFGYGLSYTTFSFDSLKLDKNTFSKGDKIKVSVDVTNTGNLSGETVVQLYIRDHIGSVTRPVKELKGFEKIKLEPGSKKRVEFFIDETMLAFYGLDMQRKAEPGVFSVWVGENAADEKNVATLNFE